MNCNQNHNDIPPSLQALTSTCWRWTPTRWTWRRTLCSGGSLMLWNNWSMRGRRWWRPRSGWAGHIHLVLFCCWTHSTVPGTTFFQQTTQLVLFENPTGPGTTFLRTHSTGPFLRTYSNGIGTTFLRTHSSGPFLRNHLTGPSLETHSTGPFSISFNWSFFKNPFSW